MRIKELFTGPIKTEHPQGGELRMNAETLDQMKEQIVSLFEEKFGRYRLALILRYWGKKPIRHAVEEDRPRTLPFDIIADVRHNIDTSKQALAQAPLTKGEKRTTFIALFSRLDELLHDHLIEQGESDDIFYDLSEVHAVIEDCLQDYQQRLHLLPEVE